MFTSSSLYRVAPPILYTILPIYFTHFYYSLITVYDFKIIQLTVLLLSNYDLGTLLGIIQKMIMKVLFFVLKFSSNINQINILKDIIDGSQTFCTLDHPIDDCQLSPSHQKYGASRIIH